MSKLNDIKGYFDSSFQYRFNDNDMWEGQILLEDDGWFEGVVKDPSSKSYTEDRFVFGIYYPEKFIELFKWTPTSYSSPFVFHGKRDAKGYDGEFEVIGLAGSMPYGVCHIITQEASLVRDGVDEEAEDVKRRIERYKVLLMDSVGREFYDNSIAMKNSMAKILLRNYEGKGFTPEESQAIMEECGPINDRVLERTANEIRQYVKTPRIFDNPMDDDELPF